MPRKKEPGSTRSGRKSTRSPQPRARTAAANSRPLVRASLAVSVDGFIADPDGGVEWLNPFFSPEIDFAGFMATIGASVMGRKTYDLAMKIGMPPGASDRIGIVLSRRSLRGAAPGVERFAGDVRKLVDRLRRDLAGTGRDIWLMGGGESIDVFRAAGLVDRFELAIMPVLLGNGIPLFPPHSRGLQGLKLTHCRTLKNGVVELHFEPVESREKAAKARERPTPISPRGPRDGG